MTSFTANLKRKGRRGEGSTGRLRHVDASVRFPDIRAGAGGVKEPTDSNPSLPVNLHSECLARPDSIPPQPEAPLEKHRLWKRLSQGMSGSQGR